MIPDAALASFMHFLPTVGETPDASAVSSMVFPASICLTASNWSAEFIGARIGFRPTKHPRRLSSTNRQLTGQSLAMTFYLASSFNARKRRLPAMTVSEPRR
jgi:hypothetical protein